MRRGRDAVFRLAFLGARCFAFFAAAMLLPPSIAPAECSTRRAEDQGVESGSIAAAGTRSSAAAAAACSMPAPAAKRR